MNHAKNTEIIWKDFSCSPRKICVLLCFQSFLCAKHVFFFKRRLFLFKELSKTFKDFCGKFKDFSRISNNFRIFKDFSRPVRTMPWITQGLRGLKLKFYSELLGLVNRDSLKGITSYDTFSPRTIWVKILPTTGAILNPWPRKKN